jgi:hypothetical protein
VRHLVGRAVRRQCEAAIVLPLLRCLHPVLAPLRDASAALQRRMRRLGSPAFVEKTAAVLQVRSARYLSLSLSSKRVCSFPGLVALHCAGLSTRGLLWVG